MLAAAEEVPEGELPGTGVGGGGWVISWLRRGSRIDWAGLESP